MTGVTALGERLDENLAELRGAISSFFRRTLRVFTSRAFIMFLLVLAQMALLAVALIYASINVPYVFVGMLAFSIVMVIWVIGRPITRSYKLIWVIMILVFPFFGGVFYVLWGEKAASHKQSKHLAAIIKRTQSLLSQDVRAEQTLAATDSDAVSQTTYLRDSAGAPVYGGTSTRYFNSGRAKFEALLEDLKTAERFIFLEYFIIEPGIMWDTTLEVLKERMAEGVEVRLIYDEIGCIKRLPRGYIQKLRATGIKVETFNQLRPQASLLSNHRDHRKIVVIDGRIAYTGGVNFADEYIDEVRPFGRNCYFKDSAIRIQGPAVWSFTVMFLQTWELTHVYRTHEEPEDYEVYRYKGASGELRRLDDGFVAPYGDNPLDNEPVGLSVYANMVNAANEYCYISTPYLIIDDFMTQTLCLAAKRGVDVRVLTPHIPDKFFTFLVTRAHYPLLLEAGVKVYEYTPGFVHSKLSVVDDRFATVGTVNMDYRSFYLHFECGLWMNRSSAVADVRRDFEEMLSQSELLTVENHHAPKFFLFRMLQAIFRVLAPIL